jgi:predicted DNA-binding transcriptional regulator YafY
MTRNERLTGILLALQGGRKSAALLAARFEVSRRTILRDIDALSQLGVPVVALPGSGGGYELSDGFWLPPLQLVAEEASLLLLALRRFGAAEGSPFGAARLTVEEKLRSVLPVPVLVDAERQIGAISVQPPHRLEHLGHFRTVQFAVVNERWLRIEYRSVRRVAEHDILPLRLFESAGRWYVAASTLDAVVERIFRIDRIESVSPIQTPPTAAARPFTAHSSVRSTNMIDVTARLTYTACRRLEDHPDLASEVVEDEQGGWLRFVTPESELDYFARELFALGSDVVVQSSGRGSPSWREPLCATTTATPITVTRRCHRWRTRVASWRIAFAVSIHEPT